MKELTLAELKPLASSVTAISFKTEDDYKNQVIGRIRVCINGEWHAISDWVTWFQAKSIAKIAKSDLREE